jgi:hypothetical protein
MTLEPKAATLEPKAATLEPKVATLEPKAAMLEYKVPRVLWENLESVLLAQSKRYIGEMAKRLGVSERELQKRVLPSSDSLTIMMMDSEAESNQCKAYIQHGEMTEFCRKAVAYQSEFCPLHRQQRMTLIPGKEPTIVEKIKDRNTMEPLWKKGHILLNAQGQTVGTIQSNQGKLKLFVLPA